MLFWSLVTVVASAAFAAGASLKPVTSFGANPTSIQMYLYVPDKVAEKPAIIVACWDVQNPASLTHNGGGDAGGIISMVNYTLAKYNGDASKVYVMGGSSGAMMTNVMAGSYPDVFEAGAAFSGVAHACFAGAAGATPMSPNQTCAQGQISHSAKQWGDFVRNSYPGYTGRRPRMQIFHGLADTLVRPACAEQALLQWSNVLGVELSKNVTGVPSAAYTQEVYGDGTKLQGFFGKGVGHIAPVNEPLMLKFFGITQ
ncbi:feruloyl esterase B precursor [Sporothrix brasiliensis 5110]|uniref:Feruloyl esterase B n=1 Tax=Sporothrix brasiliensis 5110 TaxID=1398154 RepID=A0A0C2F329_9PEZI|nr:feruloyl esterase B precursor [Sporothrix brasiliensis 5110]KIH93284.1 feruloyl esterase B precursor [Sporothrix brasiliensis 5110]